MTLPAVIMLAAIIAVAGSSPAGADNKRLDNSVFGNIDTVQKQAGCKTDPHINPQLQLAA